MPASIIAVTGATGFIALHTIRALLSRGLTVHATVRSLAAASRHRLLPLLDPPPPLAAVLALPLLPDGSLQLTPRLRLFEADLLGGAAAFAPALAGCGALIHAASPYNLGAPPAEQMGPALEGTLAALRAAEAEAGLRRVVLTSSAAAVYVGGPARPADHVYSEADWSDEGALEAAKSWYALGKTRAERAAWAFVGSEAHAEARRAAGAPPLSLAAICPTQTLGPVLEPAVAPSGARRGANQSSALLLEFMDGSKAALPAKGKCLVDVRDVAEAHALAALLEAAGGGGALPAGGGLPALARHWRAAARGGARGLRRGGAQRGGGGPPLTAAGPVQRRRGLAAGRALQAPGGHAGGRGGLAGGAGVPGAKGAVTGGWPPGGKILSF